MELIAANGSQPLLYSRNKLPEELISWHDVIRNPEELQFKLVTHCCQWPAYFHLFIGLNGLQFLCEAHYISIFIASEKAGSRIM